MNTDCRVRVIANTMTYHEPFVLISRSDGAFNQKDEREGQGNPGDDVLGVRFLQHCRMSEISFPLQDAPRKMNWIPKPAKKKALNRQMVSKI